LTSYYRGTVVSFRPHTSLKRDHLIRSPFVAVDALADVTMEAGVLPVPRGLYQAVLDRVVVNVFHVLDQVPLIPDLMFPETPLPYGLFTLLPPRARDNPVAGLTTRAGEGAFDQTPACRKVTISFRQCPDTMEMVGQQDEGIDLEGVTPHHVPERLPQMGDVLWFTQKPSPAVCYNREKVCPAFHSRPSVLHFGIGEYVGWVSFLNPTHELGVLGGSDHRYLPAHSPFARW
jgi:hypothetical protein